MVPPVPIPNTAVKHINAESTCLETGREDRKLPVEKGKAFTVVDAFLCLPKAIFFDILNKLENLLRSSISCGRNAERNAVLEE